MLATDLRWSGNFEAEFGRGRLDLGDEEVFLNGVTGSDGNWSSVEKEARDAGCRRRERCDAAAAKLNGDKRSS